MSLIFIFFKKFYSNHLMAAEISLSLPFPSTAFLVPKPWLRNVSAPEAPASAWEREPRKIRSQIF